MKLRIRLAIWFVACLASAILLFGELWTKLPQWLTPLGLQRQGVFHWGVLGLCVLWLWLKRRDILSKMQSTGFSLSFILGGAALLALAIFLPRSDNYLVFLMLLSFIGIFTIIFNRAFLMPSILLAIYGFSLVFPLLSTGWLGKPAAIATTNTVTAISRIVGLPITSSGLTLSLTSLTGDAVSAYIATTCAGFATMGVFIALFTLMMLDIRLPLKKAWYIFLIGLVGTWLQNILRIMISLTAAYYQGAGALQSTHYNISYVIFPLWFALFVFIYMKAAGWKRAPARE